MSEINLPEMPGSTFFGEVRYPPGGTCGPRVQRDVQFVLIHEGEAHVEIDADELHMPANHVACLRPGHREYFRFAVDRPTHHTWAAVHFSPVTRPLQALLARLPMCLPLTRPLHDLIETGLVFQRRGEAPTALVLRHLGAAFSHGYLRLAAERPPDRPVPEPVLRARHLIEQRYGEPLALSDLAGAAHVSANHLVRLFRSHLGQTPMRYLWGVRLQRGAELLTGTGLSVSEIADRVGFATPYHFSRLFRERFGVTPTELRRASWAGEAERIDGERRV